jgi:hypothetical protein
VPSFRLHLQLPCPPLDSNGLHPRSCENCDCNDKPLNGEHPWQEQEEEQFVTKLPLMRQHKECKIKLTLQQPTGGGKGGRFRLTAAIVAPFLYNRQQFDVMEGASRLGVADEVLAAEGEADKGRGGVAEEAAQQQHRRLLSLVAAAASAW